MSNSSGRFVVVLAITASISVACNDSRSSPAAPAPPPLLPLGWNDVPDGLTVKEGEATTFSAVLTSAIPAEFLIQADSASVAVAGESPRAGVFEGTVVGIERGGAARVTLTATHPGYRTATAAFDVDVSAPAPPPFTLPISFSRRFWDWFTFDAFDCPSAGHCESYDDPAPALRDRRLWPLSTGSRTNFHIRTHSDNGARRLSSARVGIIRLAIVDAMEALTGSFRGRITSGPEDVERSGTVTIHALSGGEFESEYGDYCGWAWIGRDPGGIYLNTGLISTLPEDGYCTLEPLMLHEIGHSLGFFHVPEGNVMANTAEYYSFSSAERTHGRMAYRLQRGALYPGFTTAQTLLGGKGAAPADAPVGVACHPR